MPIVEGILAASVFNPADGTWVPITKIPSGSFDFSQTDADYERSASGSRLGQADVSRCGFEFLDDGTIYSALRAWQDTRTRLSLVAIGPSLAIQWYETDLIDVRPVSMGGAVSGRADRYAFEIYREGHGRHAIYKQQNLLAHLGFVDADADELADGYEQSAAFTVNFDDANGEQDLTSGTAGHAVYATIAFPIGEGFSFRMSSNITALHSNTSSATISLQRLPYNLGSFNESDATPTATGRSGVTLASGSASYWLRARIMEVPAAVAGSGTMSCKEPALRVDGQDIYTPG